ncbi:MAG: hypothetical protein MUC28_02740 [Planctomycetes bacterium]|jgi:hypothetical protein|nr:hypothetical protein [Planctomycetota bacterium]
MENIQVKVNELDFGHIGWKYYHTIRKKAMEQEFSWSGLFISLSIAFFIVITTAYFLSLLYATMGFSLTQNKFTNKKIYRLETTQTYTLENYFNIGLVEEGKLEKIKTLNLA